MSSTTLAPDRRRRTLHWGALGLVCVLFVGCATSAALRRGREAEFGRDYDRAVAEYTQALKLSPTSPDARQGLERTKLRAALDHYAKGRRFDELGRLEEALVELDMAADLNPTDSSIEQELQSVRAKLRAKSITSTE